MPKFRKKPIVIEAVPVATDAADQPAWLREAVASGAVEFGITHARIRTLEGEMLADPSDWIIRGIKGELYPCKPDIFEATYEEVV